MQDNKLQTKEMFKTNAKNQYINVNKSLFIQHVTTPVQLFNVIRPITTDRGIIEFNFTDVNGSLYLTQEQLETLFNVSNKTLRDHINNILGSYLEYMPSTQGGGENPPPLSYTILQIPVTYDPVHAVGGGGGVQNVLFYHHDFIVELATRMRGQAAQVIKHSINNIYHEYNKNGFVLNEQLLNTNPIHLNNLKQTVFNYSLERWNMLEMNKSILSLLGLCHDIYGYDAADNDARIRYFLRCCHNTAHISTVGMTALQIRSFRADPNVVNFGQHNYRGKYTPHKSELNNACNFLTNDELLIRISVVNEAVGRIRVKLGNNKASYRDILKMFTMYCVSEYVPFISWNYEDHPETALDRLLQDNDKGLLRGRIKQAIDNYIKNYPSRHVLTKQLAQDLIHDRQLLVDAAIEDVVVEFDSNLL